MTYFESKYLAAVATLMAANLMHGTVQAQDVAQDDDTQTKTAEEPNAIEPAASSIAKNVQVDATSEEQFRKSINAMKAGLTTDDRKRLTDALMSLALEGDNARPQDLAADKTANQIVFEKYGTKLHGKTFSDIIRLAG